MHLILNGENMATLNGRSCLVLFMNKQKEIESINIGLTLVLSMVTFFYLIRLLLQQFALVLKHAVIGEIVNHPVHVVANLVILDRIQDAQIVSKS